MGDKAVPEEMSDKYEANYGAHRVGIKPDEVFAYYSSWAHAYEKDLCPGVYNGPGYGAEALYNYFGADRVANALIIDVAAGTGLCGEKLKERGFTNIHALDPAKGMLEVAKGKGVYTQLLEEPFSDEPTSVEEDTYDGVVITGGMGEGHIPVAGLDEMLRIVKPGGVVCIVMREEYLETVPAYKDKLEPHIQNLCAQNKWEQLYKKRVENYSFNKFGVIFMLRKCEK